MGGPLAFDRVEVIRRLSAQRAHFDQGYTRPINARRGALKALAASLEMHEDALLEALHKDMRKPSFEGYLSEVGLVKQEIDHALRHLDKWMRPEPVATPLALQIASSNIQRDPLGVVLIIAPWNYPLLLLLAPLVGAIAAGNCALLKPSEDAPNTAVIVERIVREAITTDQVQILQGAGSEVIPPILEAFRFDHIFFTGSHVVGAKIAAMAAPRLVPITLELGGKSPAIVDRSANVKMAAKRIVWGKFFNAGQTCISPDYALVHADSLDEFLMAFAKNVTAFYGEDPQRSPDFARIVNARRFAVLKGYLEHGTIHLGGQTDEADRYIAPTILLDVPLDSPPLREEIFGPILPVIAWREKEEVLSLVRRNPFPLASYVFSTNEATVRYFNERIAFGGGCVNQTLAHFGNPYLPLGGIGTSGMGSYHGRSTFDVFTHKKSIVRSSTLLDPGVQYPPYSSWKERVLRFVLK